VGTVSPIARCATGETYVRIASAAAGLLPFPVPAEAAGGLAEALAADAAHDPDWLFVDVVGPDGVVETLYPVFAGSEIPALRLVRTCDAHPEQYDVTGPDGTRYGYARVDGRRLTIRAWHEFGPFLGAYGTRGCGQFTDDERGEYTGGRPSGYLETIADEVTSYLQAQVEQSPAPVADATSSASAARGSRRHQQIAAAARSGRAGQASSQARAAGGSWRAGQAGEPR
jgi:hypothetical protein